MGAQATQVIDQRDLTEIHVAEPVVAGPPARPRFRVPLALLVGLVFVAVLVAGLNQGDRSPSNEPAGAGSQTETTPAPSSTAAPSPSAGLAAELRAVAGRLSAADGARAADLATSLRQVADQVQAGNIGAGATATGAIASAGAWRLTGQLSEAAATSAINVLGRVPGATVVNLPSQPLIQAPAAGGKGRENDKGKDKDD
jgi:hypothetical protein